MKNNRLRELLNEGKPTIGVHQVASSPMITEVICNSGGFDYIELVGEYADWNLKDLSNFARAVEFYPEMSSMMKCPSPWTIVLPLPHAVHLIQR